ncbi:Flp family type IVb pilin [Massilia agilis]|uniref:Flp family type IVb pilin n=2 Tax=Massilia TaxID=149698 RepID=A0ABT2BNF6_9BURK|nr:MULTISPECIES: Flp family type IVb pilin [Massilia]MCS0610026.1 Flp family type IVb pilin [Massilia solisilvae]MCS0809177.1 Flp family type IVb pilin [Massilia agilis]
MNKFTSAVKAFIADENGVTAIEYGLIAALVGCVMLVGAKVLGTDLSNAFSAIGGIVQTNVPAAP